MAVEVVRPQTSAGKRPQRRLSSIKSVEDTNRERLLSQMRAMNQTFALQSSLSTPPSRVTRSPGSSSGNDSPLGPLCSPRTSRPISASFDGRITTPQALRLQTLQRSRRSYAPTGAPAGKGAGIPLEDRLASRRMSVSPPRSPTYVNDATRGRIRIATSGIEGPIKAPMRQEFARLAEAQGKGGVFARAAAGCLPFTP
eukprot:1637461-Rhodomonas_salina.1